MIIICKQFFEYLFLKQKIICTHLCGIKNSYPTQIVFKLNYLMVSKVKLATLVEGDQKAPFSIATTLRCRGRVLLLSQNCSTLPLIRTLYCRVLSKEVSSTIFKVFGMTRPGIEPRSPGSLANTLPTRPMSRFIWWYYPSKSGEPRRNGKEDIFKTAPQF